MVCVAESSGGGAAAAAAAAAAVVALRKTPTVTLDRRLDSGSGS